MTEQEILINDIENHFGAIYSENKTIFRVWAPTADKVKVRLFSQGTGDNLIKEIPMIKNSKGTFEVFVEENLDGVYYTYEINIDNKINEVVDIYTRACGVNGKRGMVVNLLDTNPNGWEDDIKPEFINPTDAVIYELHIRDLSIDNSGNIKYKGKYLALTESNTKNKYEETTGLDHIKELGITHLHILPSFDYNSVDEEKIDTTQFNWGYDPENYNCPEGSYSTNPFDGKVRIKEFKEMVLSLHKNGIRVVMDVVYNHTAKGFDSNFNMTVPFYYHRTVDGKFSNASACGNETASDKPMMRKYIVDSVLYWAKEYHIDGFRFDLMGIHDITTMNMIKSELNKIDETILVYGEGWTGGDSPLPIEERTIKINAPKTPEIAYFSDDIRDGIKGHVFYENEKGFVNGGDNLEETIKYAVVGCTNHNQIDFSKVNYSDFAWAISPCQTIVYCEAHDNLTIWDKLAITNPNDTIEDRIKMDKLAAAIVFTCQGIPFIQAGQEFLRTKPNSLCESGFDENSYKSSDEVNSLKWNRKHEFIDVYNYYKGLIEFRKNNKAFRMTTTEEVQNKIKFLNTKEKHQVAYKISDEKEYIVVYNANNKDILFDLPKGEWDLYIDYKSAGNKPIQKGIKNEILVKSISSVVLIKHKKNS